MLLKGGDTGGFRAAVCVQCQNQLSQHWWAGDQRFRISGSSWLELIFEGIKIFPIECRDPEEHPAERSGSGQIRHQSMPLCLRASLLPLKILQWEAKIHLCIHRMPWYFTRKVLPLQVSVKQYYHAKEDMRTLPKNFLGHKSQQMPFHTFSSFYDRLFSQIWHQSIEQW